MNKKLIYRFGGDIAEGKLSMKEILGGKGANLSEMSSIGLPIPPGFTISSEVCQLYSNNNKSSNNKPWPDYLKYQVKKGIQHIEKTTDTHFGKGENPLLVSVRSGAAVSMPGMMDTILNLGLNDETVISLAKKTENCSFALDCYCRFIEMFGNVVMHIPQNQFEEVRHRFLQKKGVGSKNKITSTDLEELTRIFKSVYKEKTGEVFPQDPLEQLKRAMDAVFESWYTSRAIKYRKLIDITGLKGTAVTVQAMVFGNMGDTSATGVCFTRNPSDGSSELYGDFLINAQGEDVVAGNRTPHNIDEMKDIMPLIYNELVHLANKLENHYKDMQDIEFTVQEGELYILQTRNGKRTGSAAIKIAIDMVKEGLMNKDEAVINLVEPLHVEQILHPKFKESNINKEDILGKGLPASPGAAVGKVVFDSDTADEEHKKGNPVILVRIETSTEDVGGFASAKGILTTKGGRTSHAAVVARGLGIPCVAGCEDIKIDYRNQSFTSGNTKVKAGDWISINGTLGTVLRGKKEVEAPMISENYRTFMSWINEFRDMNVRTNADTPEDAAKALKFGAEGIGLCRTEHMFFGEERVRAFRNMIFSNNVEERKKALHKLLPYQRQDFMDIFEVMEGKPVTIRLLDPPLHEFIPHEPGQISRLAEDLGIRLNVLKDKIRSLSEFNPMLGHRGCRLGITYPEITEMQTRAIVEAALDLIKRGLKVVPEIMIPLVGTPQEFRSQKLIIDQTAEKVFDEQERKLDFKIGTMIEIPRAALVAGQIAEEAEFFSFGTNDLTQMTFGYSRDDSDKFLEFYLNEGILKNNPFQKLDVEGVGKLISLAVMEGKKQRPQLKIGICGEHGGEPSSVEFFYDQDMDYISCSPYRVPIAQLVVAKKAIKKRNYIKSV